MRLSILRFMIAARTLIGCLLTTALSGCVTTNPELAKVYEPMDPRLRQKPVPADSVKIIGFNSKEGSPEKAQKLLAPYMKQRYVKLGHASFTGPAVSDDKLKQFVGSVGGDLVFFTGEFLEMREGSRMVLGSYTTPSASYTTGSLYGSGSSFGTGVAQTPQGPVRFNSSATGSSYTTGNATTYNSGSATYVRERFSQPTFAQHFTVLQSPRTQLRNWENMRAMLNQNLPPDQQISKEQSQRSAAMFAQEAGVTYQPTR
jgi:hypothetical protein